MCLITQHLPFADRLARRYAKGRRRHLPDLRAAAHAGLVDAARKYDGRAGVAFATFAMPRIVGAMGDWVRRSRWTPRYAYQAGVEWDVVSLAARVRGTLADNDRPDTLATRLEARRDPAAADDALDAADRLGRAMAGLTRAERLALTLRYGERLGWCDVARALGYSEAGAAHVLRGAVAKVRERVPGAFAGDGFQVSRGRTRRKPGPATNPFVASVVWAGGRGGRAVA